ncbi:MAG: YabP/YqfC family sporulation protein [Clostridia bacterium]|nr:YabP/YqfC family sporulation protein [Clostridia bacterium]
MNELAKKEEKSSEHILTLENRKKLSVTGVIEVVSATDKSVIAKTKEKTLCINGSELRVSKLVLEEFFLSVEGVIDGFKYIEKQTKGLFKKVFK